MLRRKETMDGNTASAYVSYAFSEVAAIYPITPSSPMAELADQWSDEGRTNIFGQRLRVIQMQSEGGAAGTMHGSLQAGALTTTYTSSQGLLLMIPNIYKITGELLPGVFHVSARSLASNALSIFGDHQDVMSIRQTGAAMLCSSSVQECMDLGTISHLCAIKSRIPFVHFFDGFRTSHELQKIDVLEYDELSGLIDMEAVHQFRNRALNPDHPVLRGQTQNPDIFFQLRESVNKFYLSLPGVVKSYMKQINTLTGRSYQLFNYYGSPKADKIIAAMGSSCEVIKEAIDYLNHGGGNYGLVQVHLYRPFSARHLLGAIPKTVKRIAVLDRTKEPGSAGEPLYLDIKNAYYGHEEAPLIVGGRYGLASKDFTPGDVFAVFRNLENEQPKDGFTVNINDDVTYTSLPKIDNVMNTIPGGTISCKFWGYGSDGTVSANKSAVKIIGSHTDQYVQAYFAYDSKKSGGLTVSHLRYGSRPIHSSYLVADADFIACHNQTYVGQYDLLDGIKENGVFLLNCTWTDEKIDSHLPASMKEAIISKNIRFYTIDAFKIASGLVLGRRINMIMEAAFFRLMKPLPLSEAIRYLKSEISKNYGRQGAEIVDKNLKAVDLAIESIHAVCVPMLTKEETVGNNCRDQKPDFVKRIMDPMNMQKGDSIPVSGFNGIEDGTHPTGTTKYEKRGTAIRIPIWDQDKCLQCNQCAFICPHSVLRPLLLTKKQSEATDLSVKKAFGYKDKLYYMGISPLDCTGCGNCAEVCPAKEKALVMEPLQMHVKKLEEEWEFIETHEPEALTKEQISTVKGSQFKKPYFEFSGACAGCGETPYAKLITQLYGDRMMISNSAGCATVWGGSPPAIPYTKDRNGRGPAWGFSLFEDNAEYGLGMYLGYSTIRNLMRNDLNQLREMSKDEQLILSINQWIENYDSGDKSREYSDFLIQNLEMHLNLKLAKKIYKRRDFLVKRSNWVFGGDGWAYDIGYGGLDHVLSTGEDINMMVFDTEVYSNTGGQSSKATPKSAIAKFSAGGKRNKKKNLGMMAMNYGNVYVAQIALAADKNQALKAIIEAESHPGPSLVIGYAPCVSHGIKGGMKNSVNQQKMAVLSGYWPLFRYQPLRKQQCKNPFMLDSKEPDGRLKSFLMNEVRFASLERKNPELARQLFNEFEQDVKEQYEMYAQMALRR